MSIAVLTQVYDEVRRLSIAGSVVAPGDFRLKKLVPPLEKAGEKAPVFAKVASSITKLLESNEKTSAEALLEVSTLVNAILYTQGETGATGELGEIETVSVTGRHTQTTARMLKPLLEALTSSGSGRLEIIRDAHQRGAFSDLRLVKPALTALDDHYAEIGDFVAEKILPLYGKAILPELQAKFDIKGKGGGHTRRLTLMHQIDPEGTGPLVKDALDNGSKEMKVVAIECLGSWPEQLRSLLQPLTYLVEQATSKAKDVREAALKALAKSDAGEAVSVLEAALKSGDLEIAIAPIRDSSNPKILKSVLTEADEQLSAIMSGKQKDKKEAGKQVNRLLALLECLRGKKDKSAETFVLKCFGDREKLAAIKSDPGGQDIIQKLVQLLAVGTTNMQNTLIDARDSLSGEEFWAAFAAARRSRKPAEVFQMFSPYLTAKVDEKKKQRDPAFVRRTVITDALSQYDPGFDLEEGKSDFRALDPRWLDVAVAQEHLGLVQQLARPGHEGANRFLAKAFAEAFKNSKGRDDSIWMLDTMVRVQHPAATQSVIDSLKKQTKGSQGYGIYWIARLIPDLPKEAVEPLEALLPSLPEKVVDQVLDAVTELKNRP